VGVIWTSILNTKAVHIFCRWLVGYLILFRFFV